LDESPLAQFAVARRLNRDNGGEAW
jgi:hypothetical protein